MACTLWLTLPPSACASPTLNTILAGNYVEFHNRRHRPGAAHRKFGAYPPWPGLARAGLAWAWLPGPRCTLPVSLAPSALTAPGKWPQLQTADQRRLNMQVVPPIREQLGYNTPAPKTPPPVRQVRPHGAAAWGGL